MDLTLPTPEENLAFDVAWLDECETGGNDEVLRFWESDRTFVVLGHTGEMEKEVDLAACRADGIPVLRRESGGGTVLQGPGCLNYALVLKIPASGPLASVTGTTRHVMKRHRDALSFMVDGHVRVRGTSDLTLGSLKFSGNAQRRKRHALLFHGTFLLNFDLFLISKYLHVPGRQPKYRHGRPHEAFVTNLEMKAETVKDVLRRAWGAETP